jgi:hypothetical protein
VAVLATTLAPGGLAASGAPTGSGDGDFLHQVGARRRMPVRPQIMPGPVGEAV